MAKSVRGSNAWIRRTVPDRETLASAGEGQQAISQPPDDEQWGEPAMEAISSRPVEYGEQSGAASYAPRQTGKNRRG